MVLDEVTSALDGKTEADVLANMAALPGRTVFVAAHRAKAREFATMRLRVDGGVVSAVQGFRLRITVWGIGRLMRLIGRYCCLPEGCLVASVIALAA